MLCTAATKHNPVMCCTACTEYEAGHALYLHTQATRPVLYCTAYTEYRANEALYLHSHNKKAVMYCPAYTEYEAGHALYCSHKAQHQICVVLHTRKSRLALQPQSTIPVMCCTAYKEKMDHALYCMHRAQYQ